MPSASQVVAQARWTLRVPLLLLSLLLIIATGVAGLTVYALRGQRTEIARARIEAGRHLASLLAGRIDHALQMAIKEPLLPLNHARDEDLTDARLQRLQSQYPYIDAVLLLDRQMQAIRSRPSMMDEYRQRLIGWITERLQTEAAAPGDDRAAVRTFLETVDGSPTVFAFLPVRTSAGTSEDSVPGVDRWVLIQADLRHLRGAVVDPIARQFEQDQHVVVRFGDPSTAAAGGGNGLQVSPLFPGWTVSVDTPSIDGGSSSTTQTAIVAASAGLLLAVFLICVVIAWDLRREYALVELRNRFVANVSHELRTPLSLIRMCAETLSMGRIQDPGRRQQYLDRIVAESERLSTMITDVLDFSNLRRGIPTYRLRAESLGDTVDTVVRHYLPEWQRRGARLRLSIDDGLPAVAHDAGAIRQVLLNLVDNAIEHGGDRQNILVGLAAEDGMVTLRVTDHGRGISEAEARELKRSMRRGQVAAAAAGSGLGLALVQQISNIHRARFDLGRPAGHDGLEATIAFPAVGAA